MQKSKKVTIILTLALTLFFLFCQNYLIKFGVIYTYLLRPICFISVAAIINFLIASQLTKKNNRADIMQYVIITSLLYIIIYTLSGLIPGFGKNPFDTSIRGILINIFSNVPVYFALEFMRYKLINNVYRRDKKLVFVLIVIAFSIWDLNLRSVFSGRVVPYTVFAFVFYKLIPIVIENILFTYIAQNGDFVPNVTYKIIYGLFLWTFPILPKLPLIFEAIISTIMPFFLLLYVRFHINSKDIRYLQTNMYDENPRGLIPFTIILIAMIWFTLGAFPIKPVGVATESMFPTIGIGDMVLMKQIDGDKIKVGDIIGYKLDEQTIVHRVASISRNESMDCVYITKGDNNEDVDFHPVTEEQLVGKVIFKVKYIAKPTIWLHMVYSGREDVGVETGK